jgi:hypothetical protein
LHEPEFYNPPHTMMSSFTWQNKALLTNTRVSQSDQT